MIAPAFVLLFFIGGLTALAIGVGLIFKSHRVFRLFDTLKAVEIAGGRWVSTPILTVDADKMNLSLDKWVATYPRTAGLIIAFPALGMVLYFGDQLLRQT